jgi:DNA polymerase III subunit epsilon
MKSGFKWIILDTETDGFQNPIHVLEVGAQLMDGWSPVGEPFRILISHNIDIPWAATEIHGYNRAYLQTHGVDPINAYEALRHYVKDYPVVAHNLSFDWDRALLKEWERLGIPQIGRRGFCSAQLSRRVIPEAENFRLEYLKDLFSLNNKNSHQAVNDVMTLVQLMTEIIAPRLSQVSIDSFELIERFIKKEVKACKKIIDNKIVFSAEKPRRRINQTEVNNGPATPVYHIARPGKIIGKFFLPELFSGLNNCTLSYDDFYWTDGMAQEWRKLIEIKELINLAGQKKEPDKPKMASQKQVLYLTWLGIRDPHLLSQAKARSLCASHGGGMGYAPEGKNWATERLILYPEIYKDELLDYLSGTLLQECIDLYEEEYFDSSLSLDEETAMAVINRLQDEDYKWWNNPEFKRIFLDKLKELHPNCCDGKSVYYYKKLPIILSQFVRQRVVGSSEKLSKDKIYKVMQSLYEQEPKWHESNDYRDRFYDALKFHFPSCCDGQSGELRRTEKRQEKIIQAEQARNQIITFIDLANNGDPVAQFKIGLAKRTLGLLEINPITLNDSLDWLKKSALAGNTDAWLEIAFFLNSTKPRYITSENRIEIRAWLRICYRSGKYNSGIYEINGETRYVANPVYQRLFKEMERLDSYINQEDREKIEVRFLELCSLLDLTPD